jgi:light-regulated signal transduction histidine kinase (bacteriophytochrome)
LHTADIKPHDGGEGSEDDLAQFARIASHDMQEPLRRIIAYCDILKQDHGANLSKEAEEIANVIQSGGRRLRLIVNDLLIYARVRGQLDRAFEPVDMTAVLGHATDEMQDILEAQDVRIDAVHLPLVWGRAPLFKMVFRHLLSNALKHSGTHAPIINIAVGDEGDAWQFAVADKGMGVAPRHADRIFKIFQGLDDKDERDGSGAGLAICKLIIERCGGRIWLDRSYDQGARFLFTLPKAKPAGGGPIPLKNMTQIGPLRLM